MSEVKQDWRRRDHFKQIQNSRSLFNDKIQSYTNNSTILQALEIHNEGTVYDGGGNDFHHN